MNSTVELRTAKLVVAAWRDVLFQIWLGRGDAADIREGAAAVGKYLERQSGQIVAISVVHPQAMGPVDGEARAAIADQSREVDPRSKAGALVILSGGFAGAMVRGVATGLNLIMRPKYPNKTFESIESACAWIAPYLDPIAGQAVTSDQLIAVVRGLPTPSG